MARPDEEFDAWEREVRDAVDKAIREYLAEIAEAVITGDEATTSILRDLFIDRASVALDVPRELLYTSVTVPGAAFARGLRLGSWPPASRWKAAVARNVRPVLARLFTDRWREVTGDAPPKATVEEFTDRAAGPIEDGTFPDRVWDAVRQEVRAATEDGDTPNETANRVLSLLRLDAPTRAVRDSLASVRRRLRRDVDQEQRADLERRLAELEDDPSTQWGAAAERAANVAALRGFNEGALGGALAQGDRGGVVSKQWIRKRPHDSRTRKAHRKADGQIRPLGNAFKVGGEALQFPGDPAGSAGNIVNCRCTLLILAPTRAGQMAAPASEETTAMTDTLTDVRPEAAAETNDAGAPPPEVLTASATATETVEAAIDDYPPVDYEEEIEVTEEPVNPEPSVLPGSRWRGVLTQLGQFASTRDRRLIMAPENGVVRVRPLPLPLYYQPTLEGGHAGARLGIGKIDKVWVDGPNLMGEGTFDVRDPEGAEIARKVAEQYVRFVSVDLDDETVRPGCIGEENSLADCEGLDPEQLYDSEGMVFEDWRLMGATIVGHPAFSHAFISIIEDNAPDWEADPRDIESVENYGSVVASGASGDTSLPFAPRDTEWDGEAAREALRTYATDTNGDLDYTRYAKGFAYQAPAGENGPVLGDFSLPFATLIDDKLMAVFKGVSAAAAALNGARGTTPDIPEKEIKAVKGKLGALYKSAAKEFKDPSITVPWTVAPARAATRFLVTEYAAGQFAPASWRPEASWFEQPRLDHPTSWTVTTGGRVVGHLAQWDLCHIGIDRRCVMAPRSSTDYAYYRTRQLQTSGGVRYIGLITMDTGHAPLRAGAPAATAHYDNTGTMAAAVTVGEDDHGIWIAGALLPHLSDSERLRLSLSGVSGDWRTIRGGMELVAALAVNTPGFPQRRTAMAAAGLNGTPYAVIGAGMLPPAGPPVGEPTFATVRPGEVDPVTAKRRLALVTERMKAERQALVGEKILAACTGLTRVPGRLVEMARAGDVIDPAGQVMDPEADVDGCQESDDDPWEEQDWEEGIGAALVDFLRSPEGKALLETIVGGKGYAAEATAMKNWIQQTGTGHLPAFIKRIEKHLRGKGMPQSQAIATAVNVVKKMCAGADGLNWPGVQKVNPKSRAEACKAVAEWERKKAESHGK